MQWIPYVQQEQAPSSPVRLSDWASMLKKSVIMRFLQSIRFPLQQDVRFLPNRIWYIRYKQDMPRRTSLPVSAMRLLLTIWIMSEKENESPLRLYFRVESARTRVLLLLLRRLWTVRLPWMKTGISWGQSVLLFWQGQLRLGRSSISLLKTQISM